jgi:hypothetical protein
MSAGARKARQVSVMATDKQMVFANCVTKQGMTYTEAAKVAYPDNKDPSSAARQALRSSAVRKMIFEGQIKAVRMKADAASFQTLYSICTNEEAKDSDRINAAKALTSSYGIGSVKGENGEGLALEDLALDELDKFILTAEKSLQINGDTCQEQDDLIVEAEFAPIESQKSMDEPGDHNNKP